QQWRVAGRRRRSAEHDREDSDRCMRRRRTHRVDDVRIRDAARAGARALTWTARSDSVADSDQLARIHRPRRSRARSTSVAVQEAMNITIKQNVPRPSALGSKPTRGDELDRTRRIQIRRGLQRLRMKKRALKTGAKVGDDTESKLIRLLRILIAPYQDRENAQQQLLLRAVTTSTGLTLTYFGKLVGQQRNGVTDDDVFRRYVQARIGANRSTMLGEDLINVMRLIMGAPIGMQVVLNPIGAAAVYATIRGVIVSPDVEQVMLVFARVVVGTGIRCIVVTMAQDESDTFSWSGDPNGGGGWGDADDASVGSPWASGQS